MTGALDGLRWLLVRPQLVVGAAAALLLAGTVRSCNRAREAGDQVARLLEAERLRSAGQVVAAEHRAAELDKTVRRLAAENEDLAAALARAKAAAPGARPVSVVSASTGPVPASGVRRPWEDAGSPAVPPATPPPPLVDTGGGGTPQAPAPTCLLAAGDLGEVRVDQVVLETRAGNHLVVGAAAAWRLEPGPPARLFGGELRFEVADEVARPSRARGRWGFGGGAGVSGSGWLAAGLLATPSARLPLVGTEVEGWAVGAGGPGGWFVVAGPLGRF